MGVSFTVARSTGDEGVRIIEWQGRRRVFWERGTGSKKGWHLRTGGCDKRVWRAGRGECSRHFWVKDCRLALSQKKTVGHRATAIQLLNEGLGTLTQVCLTSEPTGHLFFPAAAQSPLSQPDNRRSWGRKLLEQRACAEKVLTQARKARKRILDCILRFYDFIVHVTQVLMLT